MNHASGVVFDIQRFSTRDGPGIRTTVFMKGCPLHCVWCHNPESQAFDPQLVFREARCIRCGFCLGKSLWPGCPRGAITLAGDRSATDRRACIDCGECIHACPAGAREMAGREKTAEEVLREVLRDDVFYGGGGGVTFSGGEPLAQPEFLAEALARARAGGLHTAVDTCGHAPPEVLLAAADACDLVLYDLKVMDEAVHLRTTGASNRLILENLRRLDDHPADLWVCLPLVPGLTDTEENLAALAAFVSSLRRRPPVHLLAWNAAGVGKYARLGREAPFDPGSVPTVGRPPAEAARILSAGGVTVVLPPGS